MKTENAKNGAAAAAILAAAIGCVVIAIATILAVASPAVKTTLNWYDPVGPLSGKTGVGVAAWLVSWFSLHMKWRGKELVGFGRVEALSMLLIALAWLGTFPPFFDLFATH